MPTPAGRRRTRENARFLAALTRTGNARLAARELGVHRATYTKRRARDPAFAAAWGAALAAARPHRRRPRADGIDAQTDAALLEYLSQGYSLRLASATLGFAHSSFLARAGGDPAFAHELEVAAAIGRDRLILDWTERIAAGPVFEATAEGTPGMSVDHAIHLIRLNQRHGAFQRSVERRRLARVPKPFSHYAPGIRAKLAAAARQRHFEETGSWRFPDEAGPEGLDERQFGDPPDAADAKRRRS